MAWLHGRLTHRSSIRSSRLPCIWLLSCMVCSWKAATKRPKNQITEYKVLKGPAMWLGPSVIHVPQWCQNTGSWHGITMTGPASGGTNPNGGQACGYAEEAGGFVLQQLCRTQLLVSLAAWVDFWQIPPLAPPVSLNQIGE